MAAQKKVKTAKQIRYLMSEGSPLTAEQKKKLRSELRSGEVRVRGKR